MYIHYRRTYQHGEITISKSPMFSPLNLQNKEIENTKLWIRKLNTVSLSTLVVKLYKVVIKFKSQPIVLVSCSSCFLFSNGTERTFFVMASRKQQIIVNCLEIQSESSLLFYTLLTPIKSEIVKLARLYLHERIPAISNLVRWC